MTYGKCTVHGLVGKDFVMFGCIICLISSAGRYNSNTNSRVAFERIYTPLLSPPMFLIFDDLRYLR